MFLMAACQAADQGTSFGQEDKVGFGSQWAVAKDSTTGYLSGGGFQLIYTRSESGWTGEVEVV